MVIQCLRYEYSEVENKYDVYRGKDCIKWFCESLKEHAIKIIKKEEKKKMIPSTNKELISYHNQENCHTFKKKLMENMIKLKRFA